jgi:hypothetical protein
MSRVHKAVLVLMKAAQTKQRSKRKTPWPDSESAPLVGEVTADELLILNSEQRQCMRKAASLSSSARLLRA